VARSSRLRSLGRAGISAATFGACVAFVLAVVGRDWGGALVAGVVLVGTLSSNGLVFVALMVAVAFAQWIAAGCAAVGTLSWMLMVAAHLRPRPVWDDSPLATTVAALPGSIRERLERAAASTGDHRVHTGVILRTAIADSPTRWRPLNITTIPLASEGGLVAGTRWTVCAAEAVLIARTLAGADQEVDLHILGAAAMLAPSSAGYTCGGPGGASEIAGLDLAQAIRTLMVAAKIPGGELIMPRLLHAESTGGEPGADLSDSVWRDLRSGEVGRISLRLLVGLPARRRVPWPTSPIIRPSVVPAPPNNPGPPTPDPDRQVGALHRPTVPLSRSNTAEPEPGTSPPAPHHVVSGGPIGSPPPPASHPDRPVTGGPSGGAPTLREAFRRQVRVWPPIARVCWWMFRPLYTAAGAVAAFAGMGQFGVARCLVAAAAIVLVRPIRRPWIGAVAALGVAAVLPWSGVALGLRTAVTVCAIALAGPGWRAGLAVVSRGRRILVEVRDVDTAWAQAAAVSATDGVELVDMLSTIWMAAWCEADGLTLARTTWRIAAGLLLDRWPFGGYRSFEVGIARLSVAETVINALTAIISAAGVVGGLLVFASPREGHLFGLDLPPWIGIGLAAVAAARIARQGTTVRRTLPPAALGAVTFLFYGLRAYTSLAVAVGVGVFAALLNAAVQTRLMAPRPVLPALPFGAGWLRAHEQWNAARRAVDAGRSEPAGRLWTPLADDPRQPASVRRCALAALAELALGEGELQAAVDLVARADRLPPAGSAAACELSSVAARIRLAVGDLDGAAEAVEIALRSRRQRRNPLLAAARAQLLASGRDPGEAFRMLARSSAGLLRGGRLEQLIDTEIAFATATSNRLPLSDLEARLQSVLGGALLHPEISEEVQVRLAKIQARGWLGLGRIQLDQQRDAAAAGSLRRAIAGLTDAADRTERAVARTLLGAALSDTDHTDALRELSHGAHGLEAQRGQLRAGVHRSQLLVRHTGTYRRAFDALAGIQAAEPRAGRLAAEITESLRRSALARTLRSGNIDLGRDGQALLDRIDLLEAAEAGPVTPQLDECRRELRHTLSDRFATAYLPEQVDFNTLRRKAGPADVISYRLHDVSQDRVTGHVVWTPPVGEPVTAVVDIDEPALLELIGMRGDERRQRAMHRPQWGADRLRWQRLACVLLPAALRGRLLRQRADGPARLLVVPDGPLAVLPWAALWLDDRPLVAAASVQLVPSLDLLEETAPPAGSVAGQPAARRLLTYLDPDVTVDEEQEMLGRLGHVVRARSRAEVLDRLSADSLAGAYLAVHGEGTGLDQRVTFAGGESLSASSALTRHWPPWIIFASCLVGRVAISLGDEPLGLPISCLLGGAHTVLGGVIEVHDQMTGRLGTHVASLLAAGEHPAEALRMAQLSCIGAETDSPYRWAGMICFSRLSPAKTTG
jgi:CHAT domain